MLEQRLTSTPELLLNAPAILHVTRMSQRRAPPEYMLLPTTRSQRNSARALHYSLKIHSEESKARTLVAIRVRQQVGDIPEPHKELALMIDRQCGL
jgi:hypothetical protein